MNSISHQIQLTFPQFEPALKEKLAEICTYREFKAGESMIQTGQYVKSTMLILEGRVKLYRQGEDGGEFFMYYLQPGNACALSIICATRQKKSEVMAKAVENTKVLLVPIDQLDELMHLYKSWYHFVLETYRNRFEEVLEVVDQVIFKGLDERLYFYLNNQCEKLGSPDLKLTHQEIASDLGSSREVISRLLKKMEQKGFVHLHRNSLTWVGMNA
jgi:CRP/FNR family transcriptional regulator